MKKTEINSRILKVKFPSELPRSQRSINDLHRYKANELKNILFYQAPLLCENLMAGIEYIEHFFAYITSMRLMNQKKIERQDLSDADCLIEFFVKSYEKYYGKENLTYNLHAHLHLPSQVANHGSLFYTSCFPFEGK